MAHQVTSKDIPTNGEHLEKSKVALLQTITGGIAAVGLIGSILFFLLTGSVEDPGYTHGSYAFSWLFALFFVLTIALGGCFWTFLHNLSNSGWGTSVRRLMENLGFVFPFMAVFAIPLLFPSVQQYLWEWMTSYGQAADYAKEHSTDAVQMSVSEG